MRRSRSSSNRRFLFVVLLVLAPALSGTKIEQIEEHPLVRAMSDEVDRTVESLSVGEFSTPYYAAFTAFEVERVLCVARDGALLQRDRDRARWLRTDVRVGDWSFDSGNARFSGSGFFSGFGQRLRHFPIGNDYRPLRRRLWLRADRSYKRAAEVLEKKRAIRDQLVVEDSDVPSYTKVSPVRLAVDGSLQNLVAFDCRDLAEAVSGVYGAAEGIDGGRAVVAAHNIRRYFVDSQGAVVYEPETTAFVDAIGQARASDGHPVRHFFSRVAHDLDGLPSRKRLLREARDSVRRLKSLRTAPRAEFYTGPVLFEGEAAAQLTWRLLSRDLSGTPEPMTNAETQHSQFNPLAARLGRQLLPEPFDVVDDPTRTSISGEPLIGSYAVDHEGVRAERVELVRDGMLETLLMSRTPRDEIAKSNGHGRSGRGRVTGSVGNLLVQPRGGLDETDLRDRLLEEAKREGLDHAYIVRRLDNAAMTFDPLRPERRRGSDTDFRPLVVLRIESDGTTEVVRGLNVDRPLIRDLERIVAWGDELHVANYVQSRASGPSYGRNTTPRPLVGRSIAVPSLLFEELDMPARDRHEIEGHYLSPPN